MKEYTIVFDFIYASEDYKRIHTIPCNVSFDTYPAAYRYAKRVMMECKQYAYRAKILFNRYGAGLDVCYMDMRKEKRGFVLYIDEN